MTARLRKLIMFPVAFATVAALWEAYKAVGPENGGRVLGMRLLPRTGDRAMPHVWKMVSRLGRPEVRGGKETILSVVTSATWYSFRVAFAAFVIGTVLGIAVAVMMARFRLLERALMPYLIVSQTVPIIVLAPLIIGLMAYGSRDLVSKTWIAATLLGVFLAFFPVAVATLRGLQSTPPAAVELMDSLASPWWRTLLKLRFPAAVPYIAPALRIAGASAVVGVVVAEISLGVPLGVGRLILSYGQEASTDPPKLYTAVFGAAALGLVMATLVALIDRQMMRRHPPATN
ncbi:MAG: NitT/TauT family transport system permease protein [Ilumatobacteraceae bacterium]